MDLVLLFFMFITVFFDFGISFIPWTPKEAQYHLLFDRCICSAYVVYFACSMLGYMFRVDLYDFSPNVGGTFFFRSVLRVRFPLYMIWIMCKTMQMNILIFSEMNEDRPFKIIEFAELFFVINRGFYLTGLMCSITLVGASYASL